MSYFHVRPKVLQANSSELQRLYAVMCQEMAEIGPVIRALQDMGPYDGTVQSLRHALRKGNETAAAIRRAAQTLAQAGQIYQKTEEQNQDGRAAGRPTQRVDTAQTVSRFEQPGGGGRVCVIRPRPYRMLPFAKDLFGTGILIQQRDS